QAILTRMVRDDRQGPSRDEAVTHHRKGPLERRELVVHRDPERLKKPRKFRGTGARAKCAADGSNEVVAHREGPVPPPAYDLARQSMRPAFVAVLAEDRRE